VIFVISTLEIVGAVRSLLEPPPPEEQIGQSDSSFVVVKVSSEV
jgi:hypothetical protein